MPEYRIYQMARDNPSTWLVEAPNFETDAHAVERARHHAETGRDIELWEGRRLVASMKGEERPRPEERPRGA